MTQSTLNSKDSNEQEFFYNDLINLLKSIDYTVESFAEEITERKEFTKDELYWMKNTPISQIEISPKKDTDPPFFYLSDSKGNELKVSDRPATNSEFRAEKFKAFFNEAKKQPSTSNSSLYASIETHVKVLKNNSAYQYGISYHINNQVAKLLPGVDAKNPFFQQIKDHLLKRFNEKSDKFQTILNRDRNMEPGIVFNEVQKQILSNLENNEFREIINDIFKDPIPKHCQPFLNTLQQLNELIETLPAAEKNKVNEAKQNHLLGNTINIDDFEKACGDLYGKSPAPPKQERFAKLFNVIRSMKVAILKFTHSYSKPKVMPSKPTLKDTVQHFKDSLNTLRGDPDTPNDKIAPLKPR